MFHSSSFDLPDWFLPQCGINAAEIESLNHRITGLEQSQRQMVLMMQGIQHTLSAMSRQPPIPFPLPFTSQETPHDDDTDGDESYDEGLKDIDNVLKQFHHVKTIGRLAVALAQESVFGNEELRNNFP